MSIPTRPQPLLYATSKNPRAPWSHLRYAVVYALVPFFTGLSIFLAFLVTRMQWLVAAGLFALILGAICAFSGTKSLIRHVQEERKRHGRLDADTGWRAAGTALLLALNYPLAYVCVEITFRIINHDW